MCVCVHAGETIHNSGHGGVLAYGHYYVIVTEPFLNQLNIYVRAYIFGSSRSDVQQSLQFVR